MSQRCNMCVQRAIDTCVALAVDHVAGGVGRRAEQRSKGLDGLEILSQWQLFGFTQRRAMHHGQGRTVIIIKHCTFEGSGSADRLAGKLADPAEHTECRAIALKTRFLTRIEHDCLRAANTIGVSKDGGVQIKHTVHAGPRVHGACISRCATGQLHQGFVRQFHFIGDVIQNFHGSAVVA